MVSAKGPWVGEAGWLPHYISKTRERRMLQVDERRGIDVLAGPPGYNFAEAGVCREHTLSEEDRQELDRLLGAALLDEATCQRLLCERDDSLLAEFVLSEETRAWLHTIWATSLVELAQAVISCPAKRPFGAGNGPLQL
jgi:hypothetical protein